jgi:hypothetical protein
MGGSYERNKETHQTYRQHNDFDQRRMSSTSVQIVINIYTSDARTKTITIVVWILAAASARRRIVSGSLTKTITIVVWILSAAASARRRIVSGSLTKTITIVVWILSAAASARRRIVSGSLTKTITIVVWILSAAASARRRIVSGSLTKTITIVVWILSAAASARRRIVSGSLTARGALAVGPRLLTSLASYASFNSVNLRVDLLHGNFTGLFGGVALIHELVNYVPTTILQHLVNIVVASGAK